MNDITSNKIAKTKSSAEGDLSAAEGPDNVNGPNNVNKPENIGGTEKDG
mgnify:CR=1 FL=1